jgi:hypothetical protein
MVIEMVLGRCCAAAAPDPAAALEAAAPGAPPPSACPSIMLSSAAAWSGAAASGGRASVPEGPARPGSALRAYCMACMLASFLLPARAAREARRSASAMLPRACCSRCCCRCSCAMCCAAMESEPAVGADGQRALCQVGLGYAWQMLLC